MHSSRMHITCLLTISGGVCFLRRRGLPSEVGGGGGGGGVLPSEGVGACPILRMQAVKKRKV